MKQCEEPFTLITPHICSNIRKAEAKARKGAWPRPARPIPIPAAPIQCNPSTASTHESKHMYINPTDKEDMAPPPPFPESAVAVMKEHSKEVFVLAWNPRHDLLATGCVSLLACVH